MSANFCFETTIFIMNSIAI